MAIFNSYVSLPEGMFHPSRDAKIPAHPLTCHPGIARMAITPLRRRAVVHGLADDLRCPQRSHIFDGRTTHHWCFNPILIQVLTT